MNAEAFAIVHGDPMPVELRHVLGTARAERRRFVLYKRAHFASVSVRRANEEQPTLETRGLKRLQKCKGPDEVDLVSLRADRRTKQARSSVPQDE